MRLTLCSRGTLGKVLLRTYLSLRVPTHPFRVLGLVAHDNTRGSFPHEGNMGALQSGVPQGDVYSDSPPNFLGRGTI